MMLRLANYIKRLLPTIMAVVPLLTATSVRAQTPETVDSLYESLAIASTPADSLSILQNIYDCSFLAEREPILKMIFSTAERAGDHRSMLEVLFVLTTENSKDPDNEQELLDMAEKVPVSDAQKCIKLYIKLRFLFNRLRVMSEDERQDYLHKALANYRDHGTRDKFDHIEYLFFICANLRNMTNVDMMTNYFKELQELIETLPPEDLSLRSFFYYMASIAFLDNDQFELAVKSNKHILAVINAFDSYHESQGRIFRNYDGSLYQCYHNMLVCYEILDDSEIDLCYNNILNIIARNPLIRKNLEQQRKSRIFYLMAKKRYDQALPLIKEQLSVDNTPLGYYHFSKALIKAARSTGDEEAVIQGLKTINNLYRERLNAKADVSFSELQTLYDRESLKTDNENLATENERIEIDTRYQRAVGAFVAMLVALSMLVWMAHLYFQSRWLAKNLQVTNRDLINERNFLKKTHDQLLAARDKSKEAERIKSDFVRNMSDEIRVPLAAIVEYSHLVADAAEDDERPYIRGYGDTLTVNTDLLIRLVNDVLELPQLETGNLSVLRTPSSVSSICNFVLKLISKHVASGVTINFVNAGQPDTVIVSDAQRVEQILLQLLSNAAKFTESGSITFGYELSPDRDTITFTVTDTGIGVPRGMEEKIFERFVKADPTSQGSGLGLYIARTLASMLGGSLTLDSSYRRGAKFIFTIPTT